jgi:ABC-type protease/lipase transport system fused ATPase/permease subunit
MGFNAQIRADIETLDVTINNYERLANAPQAWERIRKLLVEEKFTSHNAMVPCPCYENALDKELLNQLEQKNLHVHNVIADEVLPGIPLVTKMWSTHYIMHDGDIVFCGRL